MNRVLSTSKLYLLLMVVLTLSARLPLPENISLYLDQFLFIALPVLLVAYLTKIDMKTRFKIKKFHPVTVIYLVLIFLAALPLTGFVGDLTTFIFGANSSGINAFVDALDVGPLQMLFIMAITPAICEELMFRGLLLDLRSKVSIHHLALLNGLMFGLFHVGYDQVFYTFVLGTVYGYVAIMTGSIFTTMLLHFLNNSISVLPMLFSEGTEPATQTAIQVVTFHTLWPMFIPAVIGVFLIIFALKKIKKIYGYQDQDRLMTAEDDEKQGCIW